MSSENYFYLSPYKSIKHSTYFNVYDYLFESFKGRKITFVEIGVLGGGSLFMWRDFFGPGSRIIGIDINPVAKQLESYGFEIFIGNQSDPGFWAEFAKSVPAIDVILDDGGHTYIQQISTVLQCSDLVSDGGLIVVEDTHTSYMGGFGYRRHSFVRWAKKCVDLVNYRFSSLSGRKQTKKIWSIEFFESIIAFRINKTLASQVSAPASNQGLDTAAVDMRAVDAFSRRSMSLFGTFIPNLRLLKLFRRSP